MNDRQASNRALERELERARHELETAYRELQSTVEELETTNEELETMNDELRARTADVLRANAFLSSVLASIGQAVLVLDRELRVLAWSEQAAELLRLDEGIECRHLLDLEIDLPVAELRGPVQQVLSGAGHPPVTIDGGRSRYSVAFALLDGDGPDSAVGVILLFEAEPAG